jgi:hypothetical protein
MWCSAMAGHLPALLMELLMSDTIEESTRNSIVRGVHASSVPLVADWTRENSMTCASARDDCTYAANRTCIVGAGR